MVLGRDDVGDDDVGGMNSYFYDVNSYDGGSDGADG